MKKLEFYLNEVGKLTETGSDYAIAKKLEITRQRVSNYRRGKNPPDRETCEKIGKLLHLDPAVIYIDVHADSDPFWKKVQGTIHKATAAALVAAVSAPLATSEAVRCILCQITGGPFRNCDSRHTPRLA